MAVTPEFQRQGCGSQLVEAGLAACRAGDHPCVIVLGHTEYYPRFGFQPGAAFGIHDEYGAGDAFMAIELNAKALDSIEGLVQYDPAFAEME